MSCSDLIADAITRIRNAHAARHSTVTLYYSKIICAILEVLRREGYIVSYNVFDERAGVKMVKVGLKCYKGKPVITLLKRISKPGRRVYSSVHGLQKVYGGLGTLILSTSKGVLSDYAARVENVGGEVLCAVF